MRNDEYEMEMELDMEYETHVNLPFNEAEEMELAAELLEYRSDEEMEYFLGNLVTQAAGGLEYGISERIGRILSDARSKLKKHAPAVGEKLGGIAGTAAGIAVGSVISDDPGALDTVLSAGGVEVGAKSGRKIGEWISKRLEMELEGVSLEDMEFETARRIVRLAGAAGQRVAALKRSGVGSNTATTALISATKTHTPALAGNARRSRSSLPNSGRWVRRDNQIVLTGV